MRRIAVDTSPYEEAHGCKPRSVNYESGWWAFSIDGGKPMLDCGTYRQTLQRAKAIAQHRVAVLPRRSEKDRKPD